MFTQDCRIKTVYCNLIEFSQKWQSITERRAELVVTYQVIYMLFTYVIELPISSASSLATTYGSSWVENAQRKFRKSGKLERTQ